jgi:hypothetical protein
VFFIDLKIIIFKTKKPPQVRVKIYTDDFRGTQITNTIDYSRLIDYYVIDFNTNLRYIPSSGNDSIQWVQFSSITGSLQKNISLPT